MVANGVALGAVIYTGRETRSSMNTNDAPSKVLQALPNLSCHFVGKLLIMFYLQFQKVLLLEGGFLESEANYTHAPPYFMSSLLLTS